MTVQERLKTIQKMNFVGKHKDYRKVILKFNNRRRSVIFNILKGSKHRSYN